MLSLLQHTIFLSPDIQNQVIFKAKPEEYRLHVHNSSKTTEIYTHVSKKDFHRFNNPIDDISFTDTCQPYNEIVADD